MPKLENTNKRLLFSVTVKDCRVDTFTVGGHGGAGKDTSNTGVRITHPPSGAVGISQESRQQSKNKASAWLRMTSSEKFKAWHKRVTAELLTGKSVEDRVEEAMDPANLKVEARDENGRWTVWQE
jgi:protein subunit release factor A